MANENTVVKLGNFTFEVGPQGGLYYRTKSGTLHTVTAEIAEELNSIKELWKGKTGTVDLTTHMINPGVRVNTTAIGNYFEAAVANALLLVCAQHNLQVTDKTTPRVPTGLTQSQIMQMEKAAKTVALNLYKGLRLEEEAVAQKVTPIIESVGGGNPVGDIALIIGKKKIMIECKSYLESSVGKYGITYFTLNDDNFDNQLWTALRYGGLWHPNGPGFMSKSKWTKAVYNEGTRKFYENLKNKAGGSNQAFLLYLTQKGNKINAENGVTQRAFIVVERLNTGENFAQVNVAFDLSDFKDLEVAGKYLQDTKYVFEDEDSEVASIEMTEKGREAVVENAVDNRTKKEYPGYWNTQFRFVMQKHFINKLYNYRRESNGVYRR